MNLKTDATLQKSSGIACKYNMWHFVLNEKKSLSGIGQTSVLNEMADWQCSTESAIVFVMKTTL